MYSCYFPFNCNTLDFKEKILKAKKALINKYGSEEAFFESNLKISKEYVENIKNKWESNFVKKVLLKRKESKNFKIDGFTIKEPKFKDVKKDEKEVKKWLKNNEAVRLIPLDKDGNISEPFIVYALEVLNDDFLCIGIVENNLDDSDEHGIEYEDLVLFYPKNVYGKMTNDLNLIAYTTLIRSTKIDMCQKCFGRLQKEGFFQPVKLFF